jgi:twitching motility protein PilJ
MSNKDNTSNKDFDELPESIIGSYQTMSDDSLISAGDDDFIKLPAKKKGLNLSSIFSGKKITHQGPVEMSEAEADLFAAIGNRPKHLPLIGRLSEKTQYLTGGALVVVFLILSASSGFYGTRQVGFSSDRTNIAVSVQTLAQRLLGAAQSTLQGNFSSVNEIRETAFNLSNQMSFLLEGNPATGMSGLSNDGIEELNRLDNSTKALITRANGILEISGPLTSIDRTVAKMENSTNTMYQISSQLESVFSANGAPRIQTASAEQMRIMAERIHRNGVVLLQSRNPSPDALTELLSDYKTLSASIDSLTKGNSATGMSAVTDQDSRALISQLKSSLDGFVPVISFVEKNAAIIVAARKNQESMNGLADSALRDGVLMSELMSEQGVNSRILQFVAGALLLASIMAVFLVVLINNRITKIAGWDASRKNKTNEVDIIDFMKAIGPLEFGNLTGRFTDDTVAMEGITGGIRSSVNEAVASLREAVDTVKNTAGSVNSIVNSSVTSAEELDSANKLQVSEIETIVRNVEDLTNNITRVTENTMRAAVITKQAKDSASDAASVVSRTNEKMTQSRIKMQEVLKSVKHQGETSQEIGQVVEAIEGITDRTQIIAVNASLEAAKAGAAGAGFQVLAGEVNRLAETSSELLITITALVQRNQGETAATIQSVEEATNSVVEGAQLAESANDELRKISEISTNVAQFVDDIRVQSEAQSATASDVRESMDRLSSLSKNSQIAVDQVVTGVKQIDTSMGTLQDTVAIFTTKNEEEI